MPNNDRPKTKFGSVNPQFLFKYSKIPGWRSNSMFEDAKVWYEQECDLSNEKRAPGWLVVYRG